MGNFVRPSGKIMSIIRKGLVIGEITIQKLREQLPEGYNNIQATKLLGTLAHLADEGAVEVSEEDGRFWTKGTKPEKPEFLEPPPLPKPEFFVGRKVKAVGIVTHTVTVEPGRVILHILAEAPPKLAK